MENKRNNCLNKSLFPKLNECQHFHYSLSSEIFQGEIRVSLIRNRNEEKENHFLIRVNCLDKFWTIRRSIEEFQSLDKQIHFCLFDRNYSQLKQINTQNESYNKLADQLSEYLDRFSQLSVNLGLNCGPVLNWFELDNKGNHTFISEESDINRRAIGAAFVIKKYQKNSSKMKEILSLEIGELVSIIEMDTKNTNQLWFGKKGFEVGFFPSECVQLIDEKIVSQNLNLSSFLLTENRTSFMEKPNPITRTPLVLRKHAKNGKIAAFFQKFVNSRENRRNKLKISGILKERVFGCDLSEYLYNSAQEIPLVLKICSQFIETNGLLDGIYRLSGISSNIHKLRQLFDEEIVPDLYNDVNIISDIHCVSSLLKMFFRELPNPLLTFQLYDSFVNCIRNEDSNKLENIRYLVRSLPPPHYRTLKALILHLNRVSKASEKTGMTPKNLAIVWAPNLLRSRAIDASVGGDLAALQVIGIQAVLTEYLIQKCDQIFEINETKEEKSFETKENEIKVEVNPKLIEVKANYIEVGPEVLPKYHTIIAANSSQKTKQKSKLNFNLKQLFLTQRKKEKEIPGFKRRFSEKKINLKEEKEFKEEKLKTIIRSKSFDSFFIKNRDKKIVLNYLKINFAKIETILDSTEVLAHFEHNCDTLTTAPLWTTTNALTECKAIALTTATQTNDDQVMMKTVTPVIIDDSLKVRQQLSKATTNTVENVNKTLSSRERIEKIKAERRQQLRQQFSTPTTATSTITTISATMPTTTPTPTPRKTVMSAKWRQVAPKVDTRRPVPPIPTPRRRSCDAIQTIDTKTTPVTTTTTTSSAPIITITTLKTSSKSKRNNWNTSAAQIFESNFNKR